MVYDSKTFQNLHNLTDEGLQNYRDMLEREADRILYRHEHPFKYYWGVVRDFFRWL